jgi:hypothetical protein
MASLDHEVGAVVKISILLVVVLLVVSWVSGLFSGASSLPSSAGAYPDSPLSPLNNVNGVSGVAAVLQRGISWVAGQPANQIFGPNATGIGGDWWWNHVWKYFDPLPPQPALDYSQAVTSFDASGEAGALNPSGQSSLIDGPTQNLLNYLGGE